MDLEGFGHFTGLKRPKQTALARRASEQAEKAKHKIRVAVESLADSVCFCGTWKMIGMSNWFIKKTLSTESTSAKMLLLDVEPTRTNTDDVVPGQAASRTRGSYGEGSLSDDY